MIPIPESPFFEFPICTTNRLTIHIDILLVAIAFVYCTFKNIKLTNWKKGDKLPVVLKGTTIIKR